MHPERAIFELKIAALINKIRKVLHKLVSEAEMQACNKAETL